MIIILPLSTAIFFRFLNYCKSTVTYKCLSLYSRNTEINILSKYFKNLLFRTYLCYGKYAHNDDIFGFVNSTLDTKMWYILTYAFPLPYAVSYFVWLSICYYVKAFSQHKFVKYGLGQFIGSQKCWTFRATVM